MPPDTPFESKDFATLTSDLLASLTTVTGYPLTDDSEGSVVRTLAEAFARELAVCYQQLRQVYQHGFLDTATGVALDHVVALLGISRQQAGHLEGLVTFSRPQAAPADIPVPSGTQLTGRGSPVFETVVDAVLPIGAQEVSVRVRSLEPGESAVKAGALNLMPRPIWGVDRVFNSVDLLLRQSAETDDELRERARRLLQKANLGTPAAIEQAVRALGIAKVKLREDLRRPGTVEVVLGDPDIDDALLQQIKAAVEEARPAGIQVEVLRSERVLVEIAATLVLGEGVAEEGRNAIGDQVRQALSSYFESLGTGERVRLSKISAILSAPDEVAEVLPFAQGVPYLRPFIASGGQLLDVSPDHSMRNGDIDIAAGERARLDLALRPPRLSIEPPLLDVWVDVLVVGTLNAGEQQALRLSLQTQFDTFKAPRALSWGDLQAILPQNTLVSTFTLLHQHNTLSVTLRQDGDADQLADRERLQVGQLSLSGKTNG